MNPFSRRDFLKLGWKFLETSAAAKLLSKHIPAQGKQGEAPNIVLLVCDAMSARNLSLYGYPRRTTPNLEKLADRAFVYHNHYANGNFTSPGTSSLLTGLHPWTHRAVNLSGVIKKKYAEHNLFRFLGDDYFKLAFTQNLWAYYLLDQFSSDIQSLLPISEFGLLHKSANHPPFNNDAVISGHALERMLYYKNSLLLSFLYGLFHQSDISALPDDKYPDGFPIAQYFDYPFTMEDLFDGIASQILDLNRTSSPFFSYFHIYPPHHPYAPNSDFYGMFDEDGFIPIEKKSHSLADGDGQPSLNSERANYDAFIANVDMEIGRLIATLDEQDVLENTYFIITSDHGEMFERGTDGHVTPLLYDPVIHIPLIILPPGNQTRMDVTSPTNSVDLLPTLLNLSGKKIPATAEGTLLPGLGGVEDPNRSIFIMEAKESAAHNPFTMATYAVIKGNNKLIHYSGYGNKYSNYFEFYDLEQDLEELQDKYSAPRFQPVIEKMKRELFNAINKANENLA